MTLRRVLGAPAGADPPEVFGSPEKMLQRAGFPPFDPPMTDSCLMGGASAAREEPKAMSESAAPACQAASLFVNPKKLLTRREKRYQRTRATTGTPTTARGSVPSTELMTSPARLMQRPTTPSRYPQRLPLTNPYAQAAHARQTTLRSSGAQAPMRENDSRARGFSLHIGSRAPPGVSREIAESPLTSAPNPNRHASAVIPAGRSGAPKVMGRSSRSRESRPTVGGSAAREEPKAMSESAAHGKDECPGRSTVRYPGTAQMFHAFEVRFYSCCWLVMVLRRYRHWRAI